MQDDLHFITACNLQSLLSKGEISSVELCRTLIVRKEKVDSEVQAFNSLDIEGAIAQAEASDQRRAKGALLGPLDGVPIGLKDVISVSGSPLTCSSRMLENFVSPYDATASKKLKEAGAVLFGRLNMDEYAMGSSTGKFRF